VTGIAAADSPGTRDDPVVAAFDLDGTITTRDTLLPFLSQVCGRPALARELVAHGRSLARMGVGLVPRDDVKDRFLLRLLAGRPFDDLAIAGERYARRLVEGGRVRTAMRERIDLHRSMGHRTVVVSASPEVYVAPLAEILGLDSALATRLQVDDDGRLTGRLLGRNCRGPEKVRRLDAWLDGGGDLVVAYGDSAGDTELLVRADVGVRVRGRRLPPLAMG
jgi:phosphatidylglycerophosphatase C